MKKPLVKAKKIKSYVLGELRGYAVAFGSPLNKFDALAAIKVEGAPIHFGLDFRAEYWAYDPAVLTKAQRKKLGIVGWRAFKISVEESDCG